MPFTMTEPGTIKSISIYHEGGTGSMLIGLYGDASGLPGAKLGGSSEVSVNASAGWQTINLENPAYIASGTSIWLAWIFETNPGVRYESGTPGRADAGVGWSGGMPDPFGSSSTSNYCYSIYANYTKETGPVPVADFSGTPETGDAPLTVTFSDLSTNNPTGWTWDFGDGQTSALQNPSPVTYNTPGIYTVSLTVTNAAGSDTETKNDYITVTESGCTPIPYSESFENSFGDWTQDNSDDIDWIINSGSTPSSSTGPTSAQDGSYYIYIESSSPNYPGKTANLNSPCFNFSVLENPEVSFSYHMYGSNMGTLNLQASTDGITWSTVWTMSNDQGNSWQTATVNLISYGYNPSVLLRLNGITGDGYRSDIAIDGFSIIDGGVIIYNIGNTEIFSSTSITANRRAMPFVMPEDGTIESISMYHTSGDNSKKMILAVYDGESSPQNLLGITPQTSINSNAGWQKINLISSTFIPGGTKIWLAWVYETNPGISYKSGTPGRADAGVGWSGGMPDPFGSSTTGNYVYSIYATYSK
jgi:PKD repeat protein